MYNKDIIWKKISFVFFITMILIISLIVRLFIISSNPGLNNYKNFYKLKIHGQRGMIYDCNGLPLVENENKIFASIIPEKENYVKIINNVDDKNREYFVKQFKKNLPFICEITKKIKCENTQIFEIPVRSKKYNILCHIIGYVSNENNGISGIEYAFNDHLKSDDIELWYQQNAMGKIISQRNYSYKNKLYSNVSGVKLCIDKKIQEIVEEVSKKYISNGAVLVSEIPNCEIRASISLPSYSPDSIKETLNSKNSDLINKINYPYNLGSIFKLVTSIALIESGINENIKYNCTGAFKFDDNKCIKCFNGIPHGEINLEDAISLSCNTFFSNFSKKIDSKYIIDLSKKLGFGQSIDLAPGIKTHCGNLPSEDELKNIKKMSMFSFGQGTLMVTPLQVLGFINTIASGGIYSKPRLVDSLVDKNGQTKSLYECEKTKVISKKISDKLKKYMRTSIISGTAKYGNPTNVEACAKTSTAETGIIESGKRVNQSWFAGFFPFDNPKYCIVILAENVNSGGKICGPIFKELSEKISSQKLTM